MKTQLNSHATTRKRTISLILVLVILALLVPPIHVTASTWRVHGDWRYQDNGSFVTISGYSGLGGAVEIPSMIDGKPVTTIGAFPLSYNNTSQSSRFISVTIPNTVTHIGRNAFSGWTDLTGITIPNSVTYIGEGAFSGCTSLASIAIPNSVTYLGQYAFIGCSSLISATISNSITSIGAGLFHGCTSLANVTIPTSVTSIGNLAFSLCTSLTSIAIPNSVSYIGDSAFTHCTALTNVLLPNSFTSIGNQAFSMCTSLTSITIPSGIWSIGGWAFSECSSLYDVIFESATPPYMQNAHVFIGTRAGAQAIIPSGATAYGRVGSLWNGLIVTDPSQSSHIPVTSITGVPTTATARTPLTLTGTTNPSNATNRAITWSVVNAGTTGASISGSTLSTTAAGTVTVRATVVNGRAVGNNYTQDFNIAVSTNHIPVTSITGVPTTATARTPLTLTGTANPSNATNRAITWSVVNAGTTGATINGSTLSTTAAGTVTVRATIVNGRAVGNNYTQDFSITVLNERNTLERSAFDPLVDGFSFVNSSSSFGYPSGYIVPLQRYIEVFGQSTGRAMYNAHNKPWGGSCFGMSVVSAKLYNENANPSDFGSLYTYQIPTPYSPSHPVTQFIERSQISWFLPGVSSGNFNTNELIAAVENFAATGREPIILLIDAGLIPMTWWHAVVPYRVERIGGDTRIHVYEVNHPGQYLYFNIGADGRFSSNYQFGGHERFINRLGFTRLSTILAGESSIPGGHMFISVDTPNSQILSAGGRSVEYLDGAQKVEPMPMSGQGNAYTDFTAYWLPEGDYTVVARSDEAVSVVVSEGTDAYTINLLPSDSSITVEIGDTVEIEGAVHGNIIEFHDDGTELMLPVTAASAVDLAPGNTVEAGFSDVASGTWFDSAITSIATAGIVNGVGSNRFNPHGQLSVAELITMLMRTQYGRISGGSPWYAPYIEQAQFDGILYVSDNLDPRAGITRAQAALIITRYIESYNPRWAKERVTRTPVDMADVPTEYRSAVEKAYAWGIISGDNNNRFNPQSTLTRAQAAQILYNYYRIVD